MACSWNGFLKAIIVGLIVGLITFLIAKYLAKASEKTVWTWTWVLGLGIAIIVFIADCAKPEFLYGPLGTRVI
jgi:energy-coupling factor transporter transmembrane protein EcfT